MSTFCPEDSLTLAPCQFEKYKKNSYHFRVGIAKTNGNLIAASVKDFERSRRRRKAEDDASLKRRPGI
jgi:hypothetical protein